MYRCAGSGTGALSGRYRCAVSGRYRCAVSSRYRCALSGTGIGALGRYIVSEHPRVYSARKVGRQSVQHEYIIPTVIRQKGLTSY